MSNKERSIVHFYRTEAHQLIKKPKKYTKKCFWDRAHGLLLDPLPQKIICDARV
jgi:hypothetical protein